MQRFSSWACVLAILLPGLPVLAQPIPLEVSAFGGALMPVGMTSEFEAWVIVDEEGFGEEYYFESRHVNAPAFGGRAGAWPLSWLGLEVVGVYAPGSDYEVGTDDEFGEVVLDGDAYEWLASARVALRGRPGGGRVGLQFGAGAAMIGEPEEVDIIDVDGETIRTTFTGVTDYGAVVGVGVLVELTDFLGLRVDADVYGYERDQTATFFDTFSNQTLEIPMFEPAVRVDVVVTGGVYLSF